VPPSLGIFESIEDQIFPFLALTGDPPSTSVAFAFSSLSNTPPRNLPGKRWCSSLEVFPR